jgi:hypothetical protein
MRLPRISRIRRAVIEPTLDIPTTERAWVALQSHAGDIQPLVSRAARLMGVAKVYDELRRTAVDSALVDRT